MSSTVEVAGDGVALLYAAIILLTLTWITVSMRVCVRIWRKVLGMDDFLMVVGLGNSRCSCCGQESRASTVDAGGHSRGEAA